MPLLLTVSCFSKIQIGFTFLVAANPDSPGKRAVKLLCVCVIWVNFYREIKRIRPVLIFTLTVSTLTCVRLYVCPQRFIAATHKWVLCRGGGNPSLRPAASVRFFLAVQELIHLFRYRSQTCRVTDSLATTIRGAGKFGIVVKTVEEARITIATIFC